MLGSKPETAPRNAGVRRERIDALTDVITCADPLTADTVADLRRTLRASLDAGATFVIVEVGDARPHAVPLQDTLLAAADLLAARTGGLAIFGCAVGLPGRPEFDTYATQAEALAGVRGRLTPRRTLRSAPAVPRDASDAA